MEDRTAREGGVEGPREEGETGSLTRYGPSTGALTKTTIRSAVCGGGTREGPDCHNAEKGLGS